MTWPAVPPKPAIQQHCKVVLLDTENTCYSQRMQLVHAESPEDRRTFLDHNRLQSTTQHTIQPTLCVHELLDAADPL